MNKLNINITPEWAKRAADREPESGIVSAGGTWQQPPKGGREMTLSADRMHRCDNCNGPTPNFGDQAAGVILCDPCKGDPRVPLCQRHGRGGACSTPMIRQPDGSWRCELWVGSGICGFVQSAATASAFGRFHV
jgi:hypothetical protein